MAKKFGELRKGMSKERRLRNEERAAAVLAAMDLAALRGALHVTQEVLAQQLEVSQSSVSRIEKRTDMRVSTLMSVVAALGGELELVAHFPEGMIRIDQFDTAA